MFRFYRQLRHRKVTSAAALRAAQLEMMNETPWSNPYYWGAFVVQGDWQRANDLRRE